jgi:hypothetical protein
MRGLVSAFVFCLPNVKVCLAVTQKSEDRLRQLASRSEHRNRRIFPPGDAAVVRA